MPLLALPAELLLLIADHLDPRSHADFLCTSRYLASLLTPPLYRRLLRADSGASALRFASINNKAVIAHMLFTTYSISPNLPLYPPSSDSPSDGDHCLHGPLSRSALHLSAYHGATEVLSAALSHGASPGVRDTSQRTPLHVAASQNETEALEILLRHGANPSDADDLDQTPLHLAAKKGHDHIVSLLLGAGAPVDATCKDPQNEVDGGYTPLHGAADFGHAETARLLLDAEADVDAKIEQSEWTPLGCAAAEGHEAVVRLLLERGAEVNVMPEVPLRLAVDGKWCDGVLRLLLERGADVRSAVEGLYQDETASRLEAFAAQVRGEKSGEGEEDGTGDGKGAKDGKEGKKEG